MKHILIAALLLGSTAFAQEAKLLEVLKSNAPYKEKSDACRELQHLATKAAVPTLAGLLTDEKLSHMARYALEPLPDPSVDEAFRAALGQVKGRLLAGVITSIGVRRDAKAVEPLAKFLDDSDADVARAAAQSLGDIGTSAAAKVLLTGKTSKLPVCEGLLRCAEKLPKKEARAIYDKLVALSDAPHQVHTAALRGAVLSRGKDGLPLLLKSLQSNDYAEFVTAIRVSMELPGTDVTRALAGELSKANADKQLLLIQTLGVRGDAAATSALVAASKTGPAGLRVAAIKSLGQLGDAAAVPALKELANDDAADVADAAQTALVSFPGKKADDAVLSLLSHSDAKMRATAISLAAQRRLAAALPTLSKLAEDADASLASASLKALGEIGGPAQIPGLINLLLKAKSTGPAESALASVCTRHPGTMDPLCAALPKAQGEAKLSLLRLLRIGGGAKALAAVRDATNDANAEIKETALRTLCDWPTPEALPDLATLAKTSTDKKWKILAIRGALRLTPQQEAPAAQKLAGLQDIIPLIERAEEKRLLLAALDNIPTAESLALVAPYLDDPALSKEADLTASSIAKKIGYKQPLTKAAPKIRLLILSGANNHNWKLTTPVLKKMYEDSGRFTVDVTENVTTLTGADFAKYDALVCNYTTYPNIAGHRWPATTEKAFLDYIAAGHGFVLFHAASTAWNDWPELCDLIGMTWEKDKATGKNISGHGAQHSFTVKITDRDHPVTKGMKDFQHVKDELFHRQLKHSTAYVIATTFSDPAMRGSGADEPMIVVTELGKGRVFHNAMGHDPNPMAGVGFQMLMLRGTEWAATGKVTIPVPANWPEPGTPQADELKKAGAPPPPKNK